MRDPKHLSERCDGGPHDGREAVRVDRRRIAARNRRGIARRSVWKRHRPTRTDAYLARRRAAQTVRAEERARVLRDDSPAIAQSSPLRSAAPGLEPGTLADDAKIHQRRDAAMMQPLQYVAADRPTRLIGDAAGAAGHKSGGATGRQIDRASVRGGVFLCKTIRDQSHRALLRSTLAALCKIVASPKHAADRGARLRMRQFFRIE